MQYNGFRNQFKVIGMATPKMSQKQTEMIDLEVKTLLEKGAIEPSQNTPNQFISHLFLRPKRDGTRRPVFNLKKMNKNVKYEHFKMEGMPAVVDLLRQNDWLTKIDLKDAYFAVNIAPADRKFLKFQWKEKN